MLLLLDQNQKSLHILDTCIYTSKERNIHFDHVNIAFGEMFLEKKIR